nr:hypothetical protein Iba_chr04aCG8840 [Ipomoea batatas]
MVDAVSPPNSSSRGVVNGSRGPPPRCISDASGSVEVAWRKGVKTWEVRSWMETWVKTWGKRCTHEWWGSISTKKIRIKNSNGEDSGGIKEKELKLKGTLQFDQREDSETEILARKCGSSIHTIAPL